MVSGKQTITVWSTPEMHETFSGWDWDSSIVPKIFEGDDYNPTLVLSYVDSKDDVVKQVIISHYYKAEIEFADDTEEEEEDNEEERIEKPARRKMIR